MEDENHKSIDMSNHTLGQESYIWNGEQSIRLGVLEVA